VRYAGPGNKDVPVWGIDASGHWHIDWESEEARWFESGWSGYRFNGTLWNDEAKNREVLTWEKALYTLYDQREWERYHYYDDSPFKKVETLSGLPENILEQLIQEGVDYIWGGKTGYDVDLRCRDAGYQAFRSIKDAPVHIAGEKPPGGGWKDVVLIMQPPTYISWGRGVRFSADQNNIYALDIPIAPIAMVMYDLSAAFIPLPLKARAGQPVTLTVQAASTFDREITTDYIWKIIGLPAEDVEFPGGGMSGRITLGAMETKQLCLSFIMPENDVQAVFEINPAAGPAPAAEADADDGDGPAGRKVKENGDYDNNVAAHVVEQDLTPPPAENIPPWVLTKELSFTVRSSATLTKPRGSWAGNASGSLDIVNGSAEIYRDFQVHNNPPVNESPPSIHRNPRITATLERADFGDDPQGGAFAPNSLPGGVAVSRTGLVTGSGSVEAAYTWTVRYRDPGPPPSSYTETFYGDTSADFTPISDERAYAFDVYNGLEKLPFMKAIEINGTAVKQPLKELDGGKNKEYQFELAWEGTHYPFAVARWMCHRHADDSEYGWEALEGQYERTFIGQSSGTVTWQTVHTMAEIYGPDRQAAQKRLTGKGNYKYAVFATDKQFNEGSAKLDWPVKSGYYFNPAGVYKCTVRTEQYKDTDEPTEEHRALVEKVRAAFSYQSGLEYVNSRQEHSVIGAVTEEQPHNLLTIEESPLDITATLLETTPEQEGEIDGLFKEVLEGYRESGTQGSYDLYKYRERTEQVIYLVEEITEIVFTVAVPDGSKMYTHVNMKNGDYALAAKVAEIQFEFDDFDANPLMKMDAFTLDGIKVSVRGSMYDDRN
jgi:hypothetical protein